MDTTNKYSYLAVSVLIVGLAFMMFEGRTPTAEEPKVEINTNEVKIEDKTMYQATMKTNMGDIVLELYKDKAPVTVENFVKLANEGFYNGTKFHRVIKDFMIQGGDPNSKLEDWSTHGMGGPGYQFQDEINDVKLVAGVLAMANSGPNTNGSQFFIVTAESTPWLDGRHTAFGRVVGGMDIVNKIEAVKVGANDHPVDDVVVLGVEIK
ncbi:MAG: Peptidyl-prolyl cis-trans isomerase [Parcubacteria group bacterium GW2011_GWF2_38_76]|nr:MAG: Peptidyl-prolyl cis-trans isomerase [Parcubacteria group bacterium GW2011_GWF2_38_76]